MNDKENNSSSKDIKVIFIPHEQKEQKESVDDPDEDIFVEDITDTREDGI